MTEKPSLRKYQVEDLAFYIKNPKCLNLSCPGTGKTPSVCVYAEYLWTRQKCKTIWTMPKSLLRKNYDELLRFTNFTASDVVIVDGSPKEREAQMRSLGKIFLMGFKRFSDDWSNLKKLHPEINAIFVDESHMGFKSHDSQRTKQLFLAMRKMDIFVAMSGTMIAGRLDSCFPVIQVVEPRYYANHYSFMAQHAIVDEYGQVMCWQNHEKLGRIFKRHGIRRSFESVFGNQAPVIITEKVDMSPKQRAAYVEFEDKAILELKDDYLEGGNPAVAAMRCRQIMQVPESFGLCKNETIGKDEALEVHLEDHVNNGEPLLIYAVFQDEHKRLVELCEKYGFKVGMINGSVPSSKRSDIDKAFRDGRLNCLVASPATAAVGFNWQYLGNKELNHVIFTSLDYENVSFTQAYKRAIRDVRKQALRVTVLEYANSIDQQIFEIVKRKSKDLNKVDQTYAILDISSSVKEEEDFLKIMKK